MLGNPKAKTQHHTAQTVDAHHKTRWPGFTSKIFTNNRGKFYHVGYHYVIEANGKVVQTRAHSETGAHCIGMNTKSIGVLITGNFDKGVEMPSANQEKAFVKLFKKIKADFPSLTTFDIVPHRKYASKSCFGSALPDDYFAKVVRRWTDSADNREDTNEFKKRSIIRKKIEKLEMIVSLLIQLISLKRQSWKEK